MFSKLFYPILVLCVLAAGVCCRQQDAQTAAETIKVNIHTSDDAGEMFDSYEYVILETKDDNLIQEINKIEITPDRIYILDERGKACFIFDRKGKYVGKIHKVGRGPGEYTSIRDMQVYNGLIYLLARENHSIMVYTENGDLEKIHEFKTRFNHFMLIDDRLMWLASERSNDTGYNFILYDYVDEKYISQVDHFESRDDFAMMHSPFYRMDNATILVTKRFDHTIYSLEENSLTPLYAMTFNTKDQIPKDYDKIQAVELYDRISKQWLVKSIDRISRKGKELIVTFSEIAGGQIFYHLIRYNEEAGKQLHLKLGEQDAKKFPVMSKPVYLGTDFMVSFIPALAAVSLDEYYSWGFFGDDKLKAEDNPVLFFWKLK